MLCNNAITERQWGNKMRKRYLEIKKAERNELIVKWSALITAGILGCFIAVGFGTQAFSSMQLNYQTQNKGE